MLSGKLFGESRVIPAVLDSLHKTTFGPMASDSVLPQPVHVLSHKSYRLRRNTFVFWPNQPPFPAKLLIGICGFWKYDVAVLTYFRTESKGYTNDDREIASLDTHCCTRLVWIQSTTCRNKEIWSFRVRYDTDRSHYLFGINIATPSWRLWLVLFW
jgi:hypothetical protein